MVQRCMVQRCVKIIQFLHLHPKIIDQKIVHNGDSSHKYRTRNIATECDVHINNVLEGFLNRVFFKTLVHRLVLESLSCE